MSTMLALNARPVNAAGREISFDPVTPDPEWWWFDLMTYDLMTRWADLLTS